MAEDTAHQAASVQRVSLSVIAYRLDLLDQKLDGLLSVDVFQLKHDALAARIAAVELAKTQRSRDTFALVMAILAPTVAFIIALFNI